MEHASLQFIFWIYELLRHTELVCPPCTLRNTTGAEIWQGIVRGQPMHPMSLSLFTHVCFVFFSQLFFGMVWWTEFRWILTLAILDAWLRLEASYTQVHNWCDFRFCHSKYQANQMVGCQPTCGLILGAPQVPSVHTLANLTCWSEYLAISDHHHAVPRHEANHVVEGIWQNLHLNEMQLSCKAGWGSTLVGQHRFQWFIWS